MQITADTNVLVRAVVGDDPAQSQAAIAALRGAEQIAVALLGCTLWPLAEYHASAMNPSTRLGDPWWGGGPA